MTWEGWSGFFTNTLPLQKVTEGTPKGGCTEFVISSTKVTLAVKAASPGVSAPNSVTCRLLNPLPDDTETARPEE